MTNADEIYTRQRKEAAEAKLFVEVGDNCVILNKSIKLDIQYRDNVMILEDQFKSSYDCKECDGTGEKKIKCLMCDGTGEVLIEDVEWGEKKTTCGRCDGKGFRIESCKACNGKGALLEIPDIAKARPTSGTIVCRGPECNVYKLGDRVAYTGYTGQLLPFRGNNRLRVMSEKEVLCRITPIEEAEETVGMEEIQFVDKNTPYDLT